MSAKPYSRRRFLAGATTAVAAFTIVPRHVLGQGQTPPSETITHGVIGVGGMGSGHVGYVLADKQAKLLAVCDVD